MIPMLRSLLPLAFLTLAFPSPAQPVAQTPITVEVINDSGLPDAEVFLLVTGQDIGNTPASLPGTYYPFSVANVAASPSGLIVGTTGMLSTGNGGNIARASMPVFVTASASPVAMAFAPTTLPADGVTMSTLTITLPAPGSTLVQPFAVTMPPGVTISPQTDTGNCGITTLTATQITVGPGSTVPANGCTIIVTVTASTVGNYAIWTPWLQTGGNFAPTVAPLAVVGTPTGLSAAFNPPTIVAGGTTMLTLTLPNTGNTTTLTADFNTTLPGSMVLSALPVPTTTCSAQPTIEGTMITLPAGTSLAPGGCTITVAVLATSTSGTLASLPRTGTTKPSPYTGVQRPIYSFTMNTVGSGNLYLSYNAPITYPTAPTIRTPTRFQSLEFSYSAAIASNGDLTSIDFFGIPLELTTHDPGDLQRVLAKDRVTYYTSTPTLVQTMLAANPELQCAILRTDGQPFDPGNPMANFARIVGPNQIAAGGTPPVTKCPVTAPPSWTGGTWPPTPPAGSPWPYPSFARYLDKLASMSYTFTEADTNIISSYTFNYTGSISTMGPVTVTSTTSALKTTAGTLPAASAPLSVIPGTTTGPSSPTMAFVPATIRAGGTSTLTISLPNATGAAFTLSAPFYDVMPPGVIITSTSAGGTCSGVALLPAASPVQIALGAGTSIPNGGCTIVVTVKSSRLGTVTNTTSMLQPTAAAAMPLAAAPLTVLPATSSQLVSSILPGTIAPGGAATWMISFGHSGSAATTLTAPFTSTLPEGVTTTSGNTGTCVGASVSASQVGLGSGATIPAGGCTIIATITSTAQGGVNGTLPACLDPKLAADGWLIQLTGTTKTTELPSDADLCIPLARNDQGYGSADFVIYGAAQNCETLGLATKNTQVLQPCSDINAAALGAVTNSVYGWMQADVLSALNFGYMNGAADAAFGSGQSAVWYGVPPVQFPFGQARTTNDGYYNGWAATMYNNSDAYGFAFSDRNGRPSPDIAFPTDGGTLRVWILPDTRLDTPMVTTSQDGDCAVNPFLMTSTCTLTLSWPAVANADHYVVTWSPPYATQSVKVPQTSGTVTYGLAGLTPGMPYTVTVRAANTSMQTRSFEVPVYATTQGATPALAGEGNAYFDFGFNWNAPAYMASAERPPTLTLGGNIATLSKGTFKMPILTPISVGPPPSSAALTVTPPSQYKSLSVVATVGAATGGSATLTVMLGNGTDQSLTLTSEFQMLMPDGVEAVLNSTSNTCTGVVAAASTSTTPSSIIMGTVSLPIGGCTIGATLTAPQTTAGAVPGNYVIPTSTLVAGSYTAPAASTVLVIPGGAPMITQAIFPTTIVPNGQATLTTTLGTATSPAATLIQPFVNALPVGWTTIGLNTGTCTQVAVSPTQILMPAGSPLPAGGCTIVTLISATAPGTLANTTGTLLTAYPTQAFPMQLSFDNKTIWSANFYLTMIGASNSYSVGPCPANANCIGSGRPNPVPWDTVVAPNFLERQGGALSVAGGATNQGPPFGGTVNTLANISVSFTPVPNKLAAPVVFPGAGLTP